MTPRTALLALLLGSAALLAACNKQQAAPPGPAPLIPTYTDRGLAVLEGRQDRPNFWDFDRVAYGSRAVHVFRLQNKDSVPITVHDLQPNCGCILATLRWLKPDGTVEEGARAPGQDVLTLPAGALAELEVAIDTTLVERMNIDKLATVRLRCDSKTTPFLAYELHLIVERIFRSVPAQVDLGEIPVSYGKDARADVVTELADSKARVLGIERIEGPFEATLDPTRMGERDVWILVVQAKRGLALGPVSGKVFVRTTNGDGTGEAPPLVIPVRGQVLTDVVVRPGVLFLDPVSRRADAMLEALGPGHTLTIVTSTIEGQAAGELEVVTKAQNPDGGGKSSRWTVQLKEKGKLPEGGASGHVRLVLDDPGTKELLVPWSIAGK